MYLPSLLHSPSRLFRTALLASSSSFLSSLSLALSPADLVVVANASSPASIRVAQNYIDSRSIPSNHLLLVTVPDTRAISQELFRSALELPILAFVSQHHARCLVLCHGLPWQVVDHGPSPSDQPLSTRWASVDSELATKGLSATPGLYASPNPYFASTQPFTRTDMLLVARLDGLSERDAHALIVRASLRAPRCHTAFLDLQPLVNNSRDGLITKYNSAIANAARYLASLGFDVLLDPHQTLLSSPGSPALFYWGWYAGPNGDCTSNTYAGFKWQPGAIAVHVCSFGAAALRRPESAVPALIREGVCATIGTVFEPLVAGWTLPDLFFKNYVRPDGSGLSFIEAAYAATPVLSWQNVFLGDPLLSFKTHEE
ncbi:MAG: TIGR03790 family protein [bacterium]|nr:TIGR03790 family protein [bacterium]